MRRPPGWRRSTSRSARTTSGKQGAHTLTAYAERLMNAPIWSFWWD
ncbi:hypothetical protein O7626_37115 [Micromonospora sp. WMMD1102]|nr:hypothetical protein [Micromonospora sp. WMMD1102]MDG4791452.1 hypothetical protein [Micromonospora sp. WMMD1102]